MGWEACQGDTGAKIHGGGGGQPSDCLKEHSRQRRRGGRTGVGVRRVGPDGPLRDSGLRSPSPSSRGSRPGLCSTRNGQVYFEGGTSRSAQDRTCRCQGRLQGRCLSSWEDGLSPPPQGRRGGAGLGEIREGFRHVAVKLPVGRQVDEWMPRVLARSPEGLVEFPPIDGICIRFLGLPSSL